MTNQTATREHPILFSGEMIRAILRKQNPKTMTRRLVKPQPKYQPALLEHADCHRWSDGFDFIRECPYGQPGDWLYVKETWSPDHAAFYPNFPIVYRADYEVERENGRVFSPEQQEWYPFRWRSGRFMPRHAARITLEITGVRVERLQEISYRDCIAEGMPPVPCYDDGAEPETILRAIRDKYRTLWELINAKRAPWESNPFVWCISFRRIKP